MFAYIIVDIDLEDLPMVGLNMDRFMEHKHTNLVIYSLGHLLVDLFSIGVLMAGLFRSSATFLQIVPYVIFYNVLAFGLQPFIGYYCDIKQNPHLLALAGTILVLLGFYVSTIFYPLALLMAGIGNAMFHIGAGVIVLNIAPGKATYPGLFVAPGAIGVYLGTMLGKVDSPLLGIISLLLMMVIILIYFLKQGDLPLYWNGIKPQRWHQTALMFLLLVVASRSFVGFAINYSWKQNLPLALLLVAAVVLGKAFGGVIADRFSLRSVGTVSLLFSIPLLFLGENFFIFGMLGMLAFNMTMPITLVGIANILRRYPGFAFGLTCLALLIGALPALLGLPAIPIWIILALTGSTAIMLYIGLGDSREETENV